MAKHAERTAQTKQKLMDAFWKLYCENKIEKISVKAITDEAGFYRSTFYEYFSDLYEVLEEIECELLDEHYAAMKKIFSSNSLMEAQKNGAAFFLQRADYLAVLLGPNGDQKFYLTVKERLAMFIKEFLKPDSNDIDLEITIELFSGALISLINYWYQHQDTVSPEQIFAAGAKFMENGAISLMEHLDIPFLK